MGCTCTSNSKPSTNKRNLKNELANEDKDSIQEKANGIPQEKKEAVEANEELEALNNKGISYNNIAERENEVRVTLKTIRNT